MVEAREHPARPRSGTPPSDEEEQTPCSENASRTLSLLRLFDIHQGERVLHEATSGRDLAGALTEAVGPTGEVVRADARRGTICGADRPADQRARGAHSYDQVVCCHIPPGNLRAIMADWHLALRLGGHLWIRLMDGVRPADSAGRREHRSARVSARAVLDLAAESGFELREISAENTSTWIHTVKVRPLDPSSLYAL